MYLSVLLKIPEEYLNLVLFESIFFEMIHVTTSECHIFNDISYH